jgi:hypothetical protein
VRKGRSQCLAWSLLLQNQKMRVAPIYVRPNLLKRASATSLEVGV